MPLNTANQVINQPNFASVNYTRINVFIFENIFYRGTYTNSTGSDVTITIGDVLGKIGTSGLLVPLNTGADDGSQLPIGISADTFVVANGDSVDIDYCISGDVNERAVNVAGTSTLETVVAGRRVRDRLQSDTYGIRLLSGTDLTAFDNQ